MHVSLVTYYDTNNGGHSQPISGVSTAVVHSYKIVYTVLGRAIGSSPRIT